MQTIDVTDELIAATLEYSGEWGRQHALRLLHLVEKLGYGYDYDAGVVRVAAYLHDWGAYAPWVQPGVEHQVRSGEVAWEWLAARDYPAEAIDAVVECVVNHHGGPLDRSFESRLFTDADALDLLGAVGVCRVFAMNSRDLRAGVARVQAYRDMGLAAISLDVSRELAERRARELDEIMASFHQEAFGMI